MATPFQKRLVGTVILVALGVIFLPDLLSGKKPNEPEEAVSIPLRPELAPAQPEVTLPKETPADSSDSWSIEQTQEAEPVAPESKPEPNPARQKPATPVEVKPAPAPPPATKTVTKPKPAKP